MDAAREFELAVICCRWPPTPDRRRAVLAASRGIKWDLFLRIGRRHRVQGLLWQALRDAKVDVPAGVAEDLRRAAAGTARQNVDMVAESLRLKQLMEAAQIPVLFVKGVSLSVLAYGSLSLKKGRDIDILVPLSSLNDTAGILDQAGYALVEPEGARGRERLHVWHGLSKESVWRNDRRRTIVELHTKLVDNEMLLAGIAGAPPRQHVPVAAGMFLPTLARDELFAYLCVHGAWSGWFRLKWIADVAALLSACSPEEVERLYWRSQDLGAGRAAAQALLLCEHLFATRMNAALLAELGRDRVNRWLMAGALRKLSGRAVANELGDTRLGTASIHLMHFLLLRGWKFRLRQLRHQFFNQYDRMAVPLPRRLHLLYPLVFVLRRLGGPKRSA